MESLALTTPFQQALDMVEQLPAEDQENLIEIVQQRLLIEQRRVEIARNARITIQAFREGRARYGTVAICGAICRVKHETLGLGYQFSGAPSSGPRAVNRFCKSASWTCWECWLKILSIYHWARSQILGVLPRFAVLQKCPCLRTLTVWGSLSSIIA